MNPKHTPVFNACAFGLTSILDDIVQIHDQFDWNQRNGLGRTGFYLAFAVSYEDITSLSATHGADVDASSGRYGSSMQAALLQSTSLLYSYYSITSLIRN